MVKLVILLPDLRLLNWDIKLSSPPQVAIRYVIRVNRRTHPYPRRKGSLTVKKRLTV